MMKATAAQPDTTLTLWTTDALPAFKTDSATLATAADPIANIDDETYGDTFAYCNFVKKKQA